jgi:hypothetical protein
VKSRWRWRRVKEAAWAVPSEVDGMLDSEARGRCAIHLRIGVSSNLIGFSDDSCFFPGVILRGRGHHALGG